MSAAKDFDIVRQAIQHLHPCPWHGTEGIPFAERHHTFCAQCERRIAPMLVSPRDVLALAAEIDRLRGSQ